MDDQSDLNVRERAREVAEAIRDFVESGVSTGELKPGSRLPTERDLMDRFGGGRNIVRKTLDTLENEGLIVRKVGSGTYIADWQSEAVAVSDPPQTMDELAQNYGPLEVMELRRIMEPEVAGMAASRASGAEVARIRSCYEDSLAAKSISEFERHDDAFHHAIAAASRNLMISKVYDIVSVVRNQTEWGVMKQRSLVPEARLEHSDEHGRILEAIERRDAKAAVAAMDEHIRNVQKMLFGN